MFRVFEFWRHARERRKRVDQVGGRIDRAAHFAVVAVLVFGVALGALALDVAVGQEHVLLGVEELFDGAYLNQRATLVSRDVAQVAIDLAGQLGVFGRVGAVPVVKADEKAFEILIAPGGDVGHKLLGRFTSLLGGDHDGCTVRVVRTHEVHRMALHALEPHPDVGLDVFHDVADVEIAVGVGQGGGDEKLARSSDRGGGGGHSRSVGIRQTLTGRASVSIGLPPGWGWGPCNFMRKRRLVCYPHLSLPQVAAVGPTA